MYDGGAQLHTPPSKTTTSTHVTLEPPHNTGALLTAHFTGSSVSIQNSPASVQPHAMRHEGRRWQLARTLSASRTRAQQHAQPTTDKGSGARGLQLESHMIAHRQTSRLQLSSHKAALIHSASLLTGNHYSYLLRM
mmetsp:Transcript_21697/g.47431  ORF Transcript_21697/g.47431 Transcript_21697/m.47431 type:complete len:136 (-) Transcript_21697:1480-1887(-)